MSKITFKLAGRIPSKKNSKRICRGRLIGSAEYLEWKKIVAHELLLQRVRQNLHRTIEATSISLHITFPDNRKADLTNKSESVMDALVDARILEDDNWRKTGSVHLYPEGVCKESAGVFIVIEY